MFTLSVKRRVKELTGTVIRFFENLHEAGLFTVMLYLPDHFCEDLEKFCNIQVPRDAPYEHLNGCSLESIP